MENVHKDHRKRKRTQFSEHGSDAFADHELLELLLFYAIPQKDVNPLAHRLIAEFGSLEMVLAAPLDALKAVEGVGENTAILIQLIPHLMRRAQISSAQNEVILDTTERIGDYFSKLFLAENNEVMYQLCLDAKGRKLSCRKIAEGASASVSFDLRQVVQNALRCNASMVAVAHNHPSGIPFPSHHDKIATMEIRDALQSIGVKLIEHIIVADHDYISFRDEGLLQK
ncbi:MAG: DNA repair protein RadC [Oscillospiraceae bacterium]|nr:DNA repair protein RadC [Oscillospiraceae bacterium]